MDDLKVSVIQDDITWQNPAANCQRLQKHFDANFKQSGNELSAIDLVVLPEFFSTGFYVDPGEKFETMDGDTVKWMMDSAVAFNTVITGSVVMQQHDEDGNEYYVNRMLWARPDGSLDWYDKRHLFRFGGEHHNYSGGDKRVVFEHLGWRIALFVCYDLRFPVWSRNRDDYDIALFVANWPDARQYAWDTLVRARAIENQSYVLAVNRLGENPNGDHYSGGSAIIDFLGKPIVDCVDQLSVSSANLSHKALEDFRAFFPASMDQDSFTIDI